MNLGEQWIEIIRNGGEYQERQFIAQQVERFLMSNERKTMITGREYYEGIQDIKDKKRIVVDESGKKIVLTNVPNNIIMDNKFDDLVDQKINYLLSKEFEVKTDIKDVTDLFSKKLRRKIKKVGKDSLIGGVGYLYPFVNEKQELDFKVMRPENVIPFYLDEEREQLEAFIYTYEVEVYNFLGVENKVRYVEFYTATNRKKYIYSGVQQLTPVDETDLLLNEYAQWDKPPLIPFKANDIELPLIKRVKSLQDALNQLMSTFTDCMQEDVRNTILIIRNYDGEDLSTFRQNLAAYGAIKVRTVDGVGGDVDTLTIDVNAQNYSVILSLLKKSIIENGRGFDSKDDRMSNNPNEMNIHSMYSDIDLDANEMELEFQASFELLLEFYNTYASARTLQQAVDVDFIFNRDLPINEADTIANCRNSVGVISKETIIANHPWTIDTEEELKRLKAEEEEQQINYSVGVANGEEQ